MAVGTWIALIAFIHLVAGLVLYATALGDIVRDGVLGSVPDFGDRAAAFWFLLFGVLLLLLGLAIRESEQSGAPLPRVLSPGLVVLTAAIVIPMPISGAWAFLPVAWLAWHRRVGLRAVSPSASV